MAYNTNNQTEHHHGAHTHNHAHTSNKKALLLSFILIFTFMIVEFIGGFITNSLALLSDAGHMLSDAFALGLSLAAIIFGAKAATPEKTYGYKRFEILAALSNGLILIFISVFICKEAISRFSNPVQVMGKGMMIISITGLIVNIIVAYILSKGESKENLNVRSALAHVIGDLLGSIGAIIAAILIMAFGWYIADPIASIIVSVLILYSGWKIIKECVNILMEGKPSNIDNGEIIDGIKSIEGVVDIHDLHIWMITSDFPSLTAHIVVKENTDRDEMLNKCLELIMKITGIKHITLQIEGKVINGHYQDCCD
jgi:cobalt-zinc-cadmium efflux system protein